jgi:transitional endoplasmic reticulum ATPase
MLYRRGRPMCLPYLRSGRTRRCAPTVHNVFYFQSSIKGSGRTHRNNDSIAQICFGPFAIENLESKIENAQGGVWMPVPRFWQRIEDRYKAGLSHQFLLYFNVDDLVWDDVYGYLRTKDFLMERMNRLGCNAVLSYSRSAGITFPNLSVRDAYQNAMKLARIEETEPLPEGMPEFKRLNADFKRVGQEGLIRETQDAMVKLEGFFRQGVGEFRVGLVVSDVDKIAPNRSILPISDQIMDELVIDVETLQRWASDMQIKLRGHMILLLTENMANVAPELILSDGRATYPVRVPPPTYQERLAYIRHLLNLPEDDYKLELPEGTLSERFARLTHGLNLRDIQNLWITSKRRKTPVSPNMVIQQNRRVIRARSYGILELIFGEHGLNTVGGLENIIAYMKDTIQAMRNEDTKRVPMGVLMVGPPGTGKTMLINALARDVGVHFAKFRDIRGSSTEARSDWDLHRALDLINSLAPVVVFIDEIDKIGYAGADDRERRLTNQLVDDLVRFMSDPSLRGKVLWIAASNRPDMIRREFRKRGRFDDVVPFLLPGPKDREDILKKVLSRNAIPYDSKINFSIPAGRAYRCTGADLEVIATRSYQNARKSDRDTVTEQDLTKAADEFIPDCDPDMYEYMTLLAIREANLAPLVPRPLDGTLQDTVYEDNKVSKARVSQRLRDLETQLHLRRRDGRRG